MLPVAVKPSSGSIDELSNLGVDDWEIQHRYTKIHLKFQRCDFPYPLSALFECSWLKYAIKSHPPWRICFCDHTPALLFPFLILFWVFAFLQLKTSCYLLILLMQSYPLFSIYVKLEDGLSLNDEWRLVSTETPSESHRGLPETPGISWNWPFLRAWKLTTMPPIGPGNTRNTPHEVRQMRWDIAGMEGRGSQNSVCQSGESTFRMVFWGMKWIKTWWKTYFLNLRYMCAWMKIYWNLLDPPLDPPGWLHISNLDTESWAAVVATWQNAIALPKHIEHCECACSRLTIRW